MSRVAMLNAIGLNHWMPADGNPQNGVGRRRNDQDRKDHRTMLGEVPSLAPASWAFLSWLGGGVGNRSMERGIYDI
jgi:hypothetical protein